MFVKSFCWLHVVVVELQDVPEEEEVLELSSLLHDVMKKVNTIKIIEITITIFFLRIPYFLYKLVIKKID